MGLEKRLQRLERKIGRFKELKYDSFNHAVEKTWDFLYALNIGGTLIRRLQRSYAEQLGWEEKDLTIRNAVYCGVLPALGYVVLNQFLGDNVGESFQAKFYYYPAFLLATGFFRIGWASLTKKAIGAISLYNFVATPIHMAEEITQIQKKPVEGVEPSTPG